MIRTQFVYQPELEPERLLHSFQSLVFGRYQRVGFFVLPYRVPGCGKVVYLPNMGGVDWHEVEMGLRNYDRVVDVPIQSEKLRKLAKEVGRSLVIESVDKRHCREVEQRWDYIKDYVWGVIGDILPQFRQYKCELVVRWTRYGSLMSYGLSKEVGRKVRIELFLRDDMGVGQIVEGILSALLLPEAVKDRWSWDQLELLVDFLLTRSKLVSLAKDFVPTLKRMPRKELERYYHDSVKYLQELGIGQQRGVELKNGVLWIDGRQTKVRLSKFEELALQRLLQKKGEVIDYFELGEVLWGDEVDKFSLWALSRLIYKLRYKLNKAGCSPHKLRNVRGRGYMLEN